MRKHWIVLQAIRHHFFFCYQKCVFLIKWSGPNFYKKIFYSFNHSTLMLRGKKGRPVTVEILNTSCSLNSIHDVWLCEYVQCQFIYVHCLQTTGRYVYLSLIAVKPESKNEHKRRKTSSENAQDRKRAIKRRGGGSRAKNHSAPGQFKIHQNSWLAVACTLTK